MNILMCAFVVLLSVSSFAQQPNVKVDISRVDVAFTRDKEKTCTVYKAFALANDEQSVAELSICTYVNGSNAKIESRQFGVTSTFGIANPGEKGLVFIQVKKDGRMDLVSPESGLAEALVGVYTIRALKPDEIKSGHLGEVFYCLNAIGWVESSISRVFRIKGQVTRSVNGEVIRFAP